jgi:hypothetical protein
LALAQLALPVIASIIDWKFGIYISPVISVQGAALASLLGIVVPIFSSILPIRNALGKVTSCYYYSDYFSFLQFGIFS